MLHVISGLCAARDLHTIAPGPLEGVVMIDTSAEEVWCWQSPFVKEAWSWLTIYVEEVWYWLTTHVKDMLPLLAT